MFGGSERGRGGYPLPCPGEVEWQKTPLQYCFFLVAVMTYESQPGGERRLVLFLQQFGGGAGRPAGCHGEGGERKSLVDP